MKKIVFSIVALLLIGGLWFGVKVYKHHQSLNDDKIKEIMDNPPSWMSENVEKSLAPIEKNVSIPKIDHIKENTLSAARIVVKDNQVYYRALKEKYLLRLEESLRVFSKLASMGLLKDNDFILDFNDTANYDTHGAPIFAYCKIDDLRFSKFVILLPDYRLTHRKEWPKAYATILKYDTIPFTDKKNEMLWVGHEGTNPIRALYCNLSKESAHFKCHKAENKILNLEDQFSYKYQIALDGQCCTWPGFVWRLRSNSVTFRPESTHDQWFHHGLQENIHYVSVKPDLSDLEEKIAYFNKNPGKAMEIIKNAHKFVEEYLSQEAIFAYTGLILNAYADRLDKEVVVADGMKKFTPKLFNK